MSDHKLLEIKNLTVQYLTVDGCVHAVEGLNLSLNEGETLGLVGETGAGKTNDGKIHHENSSRSTCENPEWRDLF